MDFRFNLFTAVFAIASLVLIALAAVCAELEKLGREGETRRATTLLEEFEREYGRARKALSNLVKEAVQ